MDEKKCPNCGQTLNVDEIASGKCFSCNTSLEMLPHKEYNNNDNYNQRQEKKCIKPIAIALSSAALTFVCTFLPCYYKYYQLNKQCERIANERADYVSKYSELNRKYEKLKSQSNNITSKNSVISDTTNSIETTEATTIETTETTTQISTVSYLDIKNGKYNDKIVEIEVVVGDITIDSSSISFDGWLTYNSYINFNEFMILNSEDSAELYRYAANNLKSGNSYIFKVNIYTDATKGTSFGSVLNIQPLNKEILSMDTIKQLYIASCSQIDANELARNPNQYAYKTDVALSGKVLQIVDETDTSVQFLLDTGVNNGIVNVYYSKPENSPRILEGDSLTIYGRFTHMLEYTSVSRTKKSAPSIVCKFINQN